MMGWQPKQKGKMVQNAGCILKNRQEERRERLKTVVVCLLIDQHYR